MAGYLHACFFVVCYLVGATSLRIGARASLSERTLICRLALSPRCERTAMETGDQRGQSPGVAEYSRRGRSGVGVHPFTCGIAPSFPATSWLDPENRTATCGGPQIRRNRPISGAIK